jgi:signal transduction histidine kinase
MHSLRGRLILSHLLPILLIAPLIALAIYLILLTQSSLTSVEARIKNETDQLVEQAALLAQATGQMANLWSDPEVAQRFISSVDLEMTGVTLLGPDGQVLASSPLTARQHITDVLKSNEVAAILSGRETLEVRVNNHKYAQTTDVIIPVFDVKDKLTGALLLTQNLNLAQQNMTRLTWLLVGTSLLLLLLGLGVGLYLALRLDRSIHLVTAAVIDIADDQTPTTLPEQDIREIDQLYQAVNRLASRLHALEEGRRRLLANLVHELGRPLGALQAAVNALNRGADQDPELRRELLMGMESQLERMQPLLDDLTSLHSQEPGALKLNRKATRLAPWLRDVAALWQATAGEKGVHWRADIPLDLPVLEIDAVQMSRAVGNLLSNAVKFTPPGGEVLLEAGVDEQGDPPAVWIRVSDDGPGIDLRDQARIFEPFMRAEANQRFPQGMGLGLAIANDIVQAHGGEIRVESEPGQGATFVIWLRPK